MHTLCLILRHRAVALTQSLFIPPFSTGIIPHFPWPILQREACVYSVQRKIQHKKTYALAYIYSILHFIRFIMTCKCLYEENFVQKTGTWNQGRGRFVRNLTRSRWPKGQCTWRTSLFNRGQCPIIPRMCVFLCHTDGWGSRSSSSAYSKLFKRSTKTWRHTHCHGIFFHPKITPIHLWKTCLYIVIWAFC